MNGETEKFDAWAIVEVFGHSKFAGRVTEQAIGGASFVRVDVPQVDSSPAFTKLFGASAIYSITPVTEDLARKAVKACHSEPISVYIPEARRLPGSTGIASHATTGSITANNARRGIRKTKRTFRSMGDKTKTGWTDALKKRFWAYVKIGETNECWSWIGGRFERGYGQFRLGKKKVKAHRTALELANGQPLAHGMKALHSCDNPPCCNPAHIWEGTTSDNAIDSFRKGRGARFNLPIKYGEENPAAKLCSGQVLEIRALKQSGMSLGKLSIVYCVSKSQIANIVKRKSWA